MSELVIDTRTTHSSHSAAHTAHGHDHAQPQPSTGVWSGKVFMWLFLCQDAISFFGLFAAYISVRIGLGALWPLPGMEHPAQGIEPNPLNINLTALNTFILICSSVTMVQGLKSITNGDKKWMTRWLALTALGGAIFMGIQFYEYNKLIHHEGMKMPHSLFDATFYILTGFHGMHVLAGVIYLLALNVAANVGRRTHAMADTIMVLLGIATAFGIRMAIINFFGLDTLLASIVGTLYGLFLISMYFGVKWLQKTSDLPGLVEVAGLYWHFVDLVWIILFTLVYLI